MRSSSKSSDQTIEMKVKEELVGGHYDVRTTVSQEASAGMELCGILFTFVSILVIICTLPLSIFVCFEIINEYERVVVFRHGRLIYGGTKGPGVIFIIPCVDSYRLLDLRTVSFDVPMQRILTKDSITIEIEAVVYYRVVNATVAVSNVADYAQATKLLSATFLRNVFGTKTLAEILNETNAMSETLQKQLVEVTNEWGVQVERVAIKNVRLPQQLQRAMAAEAEASREARAKLLDAEGEQKASRSLAEAANIMSESESAIQLRYLQTLQTIASEKNHTIVFPIPIGFLNALLKKDV